MIISYESKIIHEFILHICHTISYKNLSMFFHTCLAHVNPRYPSKSPSDAELGELRIKPGANVFRLEDGKHQLLSWRKWILVFCAWIRKKSKNISLHLYIYPIYIYMYINIQIWKQNTYTYTYTQPGFEAKLHIYAGSYADLPACSPMNIPVVSLRNCLFKLVLRYLFDS